MAAGLGTSFLALAFTVEDSAFATEPRWVYWPWMAALALSVIAIAALVLSGGRIAVAASVAASATAGAAYFGTLVFWWSFVGH